MCVSCKCYKTEFVDESGFTIHAGSTTIHQGRSWLQWQESPKTQRLLNQDERPDKCLPHSPPVGHKKLDSIAMLLAATFEPGPATVTGTLLPERTDVVTVAITHERATREETGENTCWKWKEGGASHIIVHAGQGVLGQSPGYRESLVQ